MSLSALMNFGDSNPRLGTCWLLFGYTLALHVLDEAGNNFLPVYDPSAMAIRHALPFLPLPVFTFRSWIGSLAGVLFLWLALAPLAFRGVTWLRRLAIPVAGVAGIANALGHIVSSIYEGRFMPGVYSAPLILLSGILLLRCSLGKEIALSRS